MPSQFTLRRLLSLILLPCASALLFAADKAPTTQEVAWDYVPNVTDAPSSRIGGAARCGPEDPKLFVSVLAPQPSAGQTARPHPVLYWYLSKKTDYPIRLTITPTARVDASGVMQPVIEPTLLPKLKLKGASAGLHALDLSNLPDEKAKSLALEPGVQYEFRVAVVVSEKAGSINPLASCVVRPVKSPDSTPGELSATRAKTELSGGLWFDGLDDLNRLIEHSPANSELRDVRRKLLKSQGIVEHDDGTIDETTTPKS